MPGDFRQGTQLSTLMFCVAIGLILTSVGSFIAVLCWTMADMTN